jgi:signal transduction histidine kinase
MDAENRLEKIRTAVERLAPSDHAMSLYNSREEEMAAVASFVRTGLEHGEQCVCIVDDGGEVIRNALAAEGIDADAEVREGRLILFERRNARNLRTRDMGGRIDELVEAAARQGHSGCRVTGEMTWALDGDLKELAEFESELNRARFWERHRCTGLCQFDMRRFSPETLREMIIVHPMVVIGDRVCRNPYYVPPEQYLSADWPRHETDWMITNLEQLEEAQDNLRASEANYRSLARRLVNLQEEERRDLARELHDRVGQSLTAMRINMELIRTRAGEQGDAQVRARAEDSIHLIESTFKSVQNVMYDLRPPMLDEYGLLPPLRWYARQFTERTGIRVEVRGGEDGPGNADVETALFRVAQEALTNVARHSQAKNVRIEIRSTPEEAVLTVEDDGIGFDRARERPGKAGYGLVTMRERAQAVGGTLETKSKKGRGTRITMKVPRITKAGSGELADDEPAPSSRPR